MNVENIKVGQVWKRKAKYPKHDRAGDHWCDCIFIEEAVEDAEWRCISVFDIDHPPQMMIHEYKSTQCDQDSGLPNHKYELVTDDEAKAIRMMVLL